MSRLYIIPTPVGNLEDMSFRAVRILRDEAELLLAEDTRTSSVLFRHYGIQKPVQAFHQHNEHRVLSSVINRLKSGAIVALVSDAGTPGISDPGFLLVRECIREGIAVESLPGATAFVPALVSSGLPCERFCFEGFLPVKKGRMTRLAQLKEEERTMVFYESPHRILKTLEQLAEILGHDRQASVAREISKIHEEHIRGSLQQIIEHIKAHPPKGEITVVVAGS